MMGTPESDIDDFGSTVSLTSSIGSVPGFPGLSSSKLRLKHSDQSESSNSSSPIPNPSNPNISPYPRGRAGSGTQASKNLSSAELLRDEDPILYKKLIERNRSLRLHFEEKFLKPVLTQNIKKVDKLSENLSNSQMQMQDALLQSRITKTNLFKLQREIENFVQNDYLSELRPWSSSGGGEGTSVSTMAHGADADTSRNDDNNSFKTTNLGNSNSSSRVKPKAVKVKEEHIQISD